MNKMILLVLATTLSAFAGDPLLHSEKYGTLSGQLQSLSINRDYENSGNGMNSTLGVVLNYLSPAVGPVDFGMSYNYAWELYSNNTTSLLANDSINLLTEAWMRYSVTTNTSITAGRKITSGEIFQPNAFRHVGRSIEAVQIETTAIDNLKLNAGHAFRMSNWIQSGDRAQFNDFSDVFGASDDTDGVTWAEMVYTGVDRFEIALFDAYAHDVANLIGTRVQFAVNEQTTLLGYARHESAVGRAEAADADALGLSLRQKIGGVTLEPGLFSVHGNDLRFQETTTGINHALGALMMIYAQQFSAGSDTFYLKASTKIDQTALYALYNYTRNDDLSLDGQELNLVVKQPITDAISVAFKFAAGYRQYDDSDDTTATDTRLFITYDF